MNVAEAVYAYAADMANLEIVGIDCHIGSQLTSVAPFVDALARTAELVDRLGGSRNQTFASRYRRWPRD